MLKSLYRNYDKMLVWLNMLCINQHDRSEREYQVGLMGEIYSTRCLGTMRGLESIQWTVRGFKSLQLMAKQCFRASIQYFFHSALLEKIVDSPGADLGKGNILSLWNQYLALGLFHKGCTFLGHL
jgi:hypothetical protein